MSPHVTMKSFGQLKLALINHGIYIPGDVLKSPEVACGVINGTPGEEISLALGEDFIVKVFMKSDPGGPMKLKVVKGVVHLNSGGEDVEVVVIPHPAFIKKQFKKRTPVSENICLDGYCLNIFLRAVGSQRRLSLSREAVLSVIRSAFDEGAADLVQLNMDYSPDHDRGFDQLAPVVELIKKNFNTFVGLKGFPPRDPRVVDRMYAVGVDLLNFPLGGFAGSEKSAGLVSAKEVHKTLEYAVGIFPQGAVWTELTLVPGPVEPVLEQIDDLMERGIIPQLQLHRGSISTGGEYRRIEKVVRHLDRAAQKNKIPLKWLYPNCRCVSPLDSRLFTGDRQTARLVATPVYRSRLGKKAFEGFAAIRRKLRIKNVSDSYESAGL